MAALAALLLLGGLSGAAPAASAPAASGTVTVRTSPSVPGVALSLDGQVHRTDGSGRASFFTRDLDGAREALQLVAPTVSSFTRVSLLTVVTDPAHPQGTRALVAKLGLAHPVAVQMVDRLGARVPPDAITSMSLRSTDGQAKTVLPPPDGSPMWLDQEVADRRPGADLTATRSLTWTVSGVRVRGVSVAVGDVPPLQPTASGWRVALAGYPFNVEVSVVPPIEQVALRLGDLVAQTDAAGKATFYTTDLQSVAEKVALDSEDASPGKRVSLVRVTRDAEHGIGTRELVLALDVQAAVRLHFVDLAGADVPALDVSTVSLTAPLGQSIRLSREQLAEPVWLPASRLTQSAPPKARPVTYTVDEAMTLGSNAVFAGAQRFDPMVESTWTVRLHLYRVQVRATDLLFGTHSGGAVVLQAPDHSQREGALRSGTAVLEQVPRGEYQMLVQSGARHLTVPLRVALDQRVDVRVVSWWDVLVLLALLLAVAALVVRIGSRASRRRAELRDLGVVGPRGHAKAGALGVLVLLTASLVAASPPRPASAEADCAAPSVSTVVPAAAPAKPFPVPVWGYYYIWFQETSWRRAKIDTPQLGCYSSDDTAVMRAHIRMARAAGISGFLVSWKHTPALDQRLRALTAIADSEHFSLGIVYQALDFDRHPLPVPTIAADLRWFADTYGTNPVFAAEGKPTVVWTGTEQFDAAVVEQTIAPVRPVLSMYASAKSVADYERVAASVEGNAYYWSSGDAASTGFRNKLAAMGASVHDHGGRWLAPAAPGFDGRPLGGRRIVDRQEGAALRASLQAALASEPDALGIISWNEWSENTYVEPSERYGSTDLAVLAEALGGEVPALTEIDSSDDAPTPRGWRGWHAAALLVAVTGAGVGLVERRRRSLRRRVERALRTELPTLALSTTRGNYRPDDDR